MENVSTLETNPNFTDNFSTKGDYTQLEGLAQSSERCEVTKGGLEGGMDIGNIGIQRE